MPVDDLDAAVAELTPRLVALRRALHQHPELAFAEVWTAATLAERLRALGLAVEDGIGGTGVLGMLEGGGPGPTLLVRADMDGLPMEDATGTPHASRIPGRSHACGHDAHAAIVASVAELLGRHRARLAGRVAFVFQPADEPMRGARRMLDDGLLERVRPDMTLSVHVLPTARAGQAVVQRGPLWASWDTLVLRLSGPAPPASPDIARVAALLTTALYDVVEHEGQSTEPVTFRVRALTAEHAGRGEPAQAAIEVHLGRGEAGRATLEVNLALYDNALRTRLLRRIRDVAEAVAGAAGATLGVEADYALPAVVNDERVTAAVARAARSVIGEDSLLTGVRHRFADDVSLFLTAAPGCLLLLGTANPDKGITETWHRPGFDIDEAALPLGVRILSRAALDLLRPA